jgi:3-oxoacyl-[acyl-carrier protein] reductase
MNPVALITGASRGIGRAIALSLAEIGYDLLLNFRSDVAAAETTARDCAEKGRGVRVVLGQGDVSEEAARQKLIEQTRSEFGRLDLLVNNAGIAPRERADLLSMKESSFDELISVNLKGPFFLTQLAANWMIELKKTLAEYSPRIVTISSISAYTASVNRGEYCISKAGVSMMTSLFAARLAAEGILVFEIRPGVIATDMTAGVKAKYDQLIDAGLTPIQRWGEPRDVAKAVSAIAQDLFPFSTGEVINVDGGFHLRRL